MGLTCHAAPAMSSYAPGTGPPPDAPSGHPPAHPPGAPSRGLPGDASRARPGNPPRFPPGAFGPFRHRAFTLIWTATVVSNVGTWMSNLASGWLMMSLDPDPFIVSMVQVANYLPMFLFAIPAGALVDIVDRRRFLIIGEVAITLTSVVFAGLVWLHLITPLSLLALTFVVTVGSAVTAPAWQAVVSQLVQDPSCPPRSAPTVPESMSAAQSDRHSAACSSAPRGSLFRSGSMRSAISES